MKSTQPLQLINSNIPNSYKLHIPKDVHKKIKEWCLASPTTEWSGTLFYTMSGNFEEDNLVIEVKDFFVLDVGTATTTEYIEDPSVIDYMVENDLLDCKCGLVH